MLVVLKWRIGPMRIGGVSIALASKYELKIELFLWKRMGALRIIEKGLTPRGLNLEGTGRRLFFF